MRGASRYRPFNGDAELELPDYMFSQALVRFGLLVEEPYSSASLATLPLWRIAGGYGIRTGLIGLPLTHPAQGDSGFIVSDRFHRRSDRVVTLDSEPAVSPSRLDDIARGVLADEQPTRELRVRFDLLPWTGESGSTVEADRLHHRLANQLAAVEPVQLAVRYAGLDAVGHYYLRYARPEAFGDVSEDERRRFGRVLDDYYAYVDSLVGDAMASLAGRSPAGRFRLRYGAARRQTSARASGRRSEVQRHARREDLTDSSSRTAPLSLPGVKVVGQSLTSRPRSSISLGCPSRATWMASRTDLFTAAFNEQRTITFIPTYERQ